MSQLSFLSSHLSPLSLPAAIRRQTAAKRWNAAGREGGESARRNRWAEERRVRAEESNTHHQILLSGLCTRYDLPGTEIACGATCRGLERGGLVVEEGLYRTLLVLAEEVARGTSLRASYAMSVLTFRIPLLCDARYCHSTQRCPVLTERRVVPGGERFPGEVDAVLASMHTAGAHR
eukprot:3915459-Rhodomonas_salina.1